MIAYWGNYQGKRHIVHRIKLGKYPANRDFIIYASLCGLWTRYSPDVMKSKLEPNCRVCVKAAQP